ncbi:YuzD family protein [Alkalihalobacillus trypoxylicola]|uniref:Disulfide oxidoreductase n=1 Tax=Alkalihalobacillus trypoxylicola TaxID=519424 RepID=A0A162ERD6_9BACI|nr:YuzD family protein [Alkalihalobacillus trypoxylicola]KYG33536.1 disulfide oxidoreductase [Alkalihalobacillus trypoxylicola]
MKQSFTFKVYGADEKCASCIHLPSAKETSEWLEAAITRKFPEQSIQFFYLNIDDDLNEEEDQKYSQAIKEEEYFYPLVVLNGEVVGEGNPNLKVISKRIEDHL